MFYAKFMFVKKGPLSKVWLAAHGSVKQLPKNQIVHTDITASVKSILEPSGGPLALRLSGQLLLGVVRIYERKMHYLQQECNDARTKMKMAFRPGAVDLPSGAAQAPANAITLMDLGDPVPEIEIPLDIEFELEPADGSGATSFYSTGRGEEGERGRNANASIVSNRRSTISVHDVSMSAASSAPMDLDMPNAEIDLDDPLGAGVVERTPVRSARSGKDEVLDLPEMGRDGMDMDFGAELPDREYEVNVDLNIDLDGPILADEPAVVAAAATNADNEALAGEVKTSDDVDAKEQKDTKESKRGKREANEEKGKQVRKRRKRENVMTVDETTELSRDDMRKQMKDTSDIVGRAPPATPLQKRLRQSAVPSTAAELLATSTPLPPQMMALFDEVVVPRLSRVSMAGAAAASAESKEDVPMSAVDDQMEFADRGDYDFGADPSMVSSAGFDQELDTTNLGAAASPAKIQAGDRETLADAVFVTDSASADHVGSTQLSAGAGDDSAGPAVSDESTEVKQEGFSQRTVKCYQFLKTELKSRAGASFNSMLQASAHPRNTAAGLFYELLVLKTHDFISVEQPQAFGDIIISKTEHFEDPLPEPIDAPAGAASPSPRKSPVKRAADSQDPTETDDAPAPQPKNKRKGGARRKELEATA